MTKEEAIKWLTSLQIFFKEDSEQYISLDMAIEALKQNQWIPCEWELPESYDDVIISAKGYVCEANLRESKEYFLTHNARMFIKTEEVDAWMPLPKAYEGGTE